MKRKRSACTTTASSVVQSWFKRPKHDNDDDDANDNDGIATSKHSHDDDSGSVLHSLLAVASSTSASADAIRETKLQLLHALISGTASIVDLGVSSLVLLYSLVCTAVADPPTATSLLLPPPPPPPPLASLIMQHHQAAQHIMAHLSASQISELLRYIPDDWQGYGSMRSAVLANNDNNSLSFYDRNAAVALDAQRCATTHHVPQLVLQLVYNLCLLPIWKRSLRHQPARWFVCSSIAQAIGVFRFLLAHCAMPHEIVASLYQDVSNVARFGTLVIAVAGSPLSHTLIDALIAIDCHEHSSDTTATAPCVIDRVASAIQDQIFAANRNETDSLVSGTAYYSVTQPSYHIYRALQLRAFQQQLEDAYLLHTLQRTQQGATDDSSAHVLQVVRNLQQPQQHLHLERSLLMFLATRLLSHSSVFDVVFPVDACHLSLLSTSQLLRMLSLVGVPMLAGGSTATAATDSCKPHAPHVQSLASVLLIMRILVGMCNAYDTVLAQHLQLHDQQHQAMPPSCKQLESFLGTHQHLVQLLMLFVHTSCCASAATCWSIDDVRIAVAATANTPPSVSHHVFAPAVAMLLASDRSCIGLLRDLVSLIDVSLQRAAPANGSPASPIDCSHSLFASPCSPSADDAARFTIAYPSALVHQTLEQQQQQQSIDMMTISTTAFASFYLYLVQLHATLDESTPITLSQLQSLASALPTLLSNALADEPNAYSANRIVNHAIAPALKLSLLSSPLRRRLCDTLYCMVVQITSTCNSTAVWPPAGVTRHLVLSTIVWLLERLSHSLANTPVVPSISATITAQSVQCLQLSKPTVSADIPMLIQALSHIVTCQQHDASQQLAVHAHTLWRQSLALLATTSASASDTLGIFNELQRMSSSISSVVVQQQQQHDQRQCTLYIDILNSLLHVQLTVLLACRSSPPSTTLLLQTKPIQALLRRWALPAACIPLSNVGDLLVASADVWAIFNTLLDASISMLELASHGSRPNDAAIVTEHQSQQVLSDCIFAMHQISTIHTGSSCNTAAAERHMTLLLQLLLRYDSLSPAALSKVFCYLGFLMNAAAALQVLATLTLPTTATTPTSTSTSTLTLTGAPVHATCFDILVWILSNVYHAPSLVQDRDLLEKIRYNCSLALMLYIQHSLEYEIRALPASSHGSSNANRTLLVIRQINHVDLVRSLLRYMKQTMQSMQSLADDALERPMRTLANYIEILSLLSQYNAEMQRLAQPYRQQRISTDELVKFDAVCDNRHGLLVFVTLHTLLLQQLLTYENMVDYMSSVLLAHLPALLKVRVPSPHVLLHTVAQLLHAVLHPTFDGCECSQVLQQIANIVQYLAQINGSWRTGLIDAHIATLLRQTIERHTHAISLQVREFCFQCVAEL
jgi:hypothetical protein